MRPRSAAESIISCAENGTVKILTGFKRVGKSSILQAVTDSLVARGIEKRNLVHFSFEEMGGDAISDYQGLYDAVAARATPGERIYVFLDEVHKIPGWEKTALHLMHDLDADIYVTGSSAQVIDNNVLAVLDEKHMIFEIQPLSFGEYLSFRQSHTDLEDPSRELARFLMLGGFPAVHARSSTQTEAYTYARDVLHAALWNDFFALTQIRRSDQLERVIRFVIENIGKNFSAKHMSDSLRSENKEINIETVYTYLDKLEKIYFISRCSRYDILANEPLKTQEKFYLADQSMRYALLGFKPNTVSSSLENIVYLELKRRGYNVYVGKLGRRDLDFVAIKGEGIRQERIYVQLGRELRGEPEGADIARLSSIRDSYPKFVLTTDTQSMGNRSGIRTVLIADFLSGKV